MAGWKALATSGCLLGNREDKILLRKAGADGEKVEITSQGNFMEETLVSTDRGMDKGDVLHIFNGESEVGSGNSIYTMEYYSAIKRNEIMPFTATWMDLEKILLSEVYQTKKAQYRMISQINGILKKMIQMNLFPT